MLDRYSSLKPLERGFRAVVGIFLIYVGLLDATLIASAWLNGFLTLFGLVNVVSALSGICPAYVLSNLSFVPKHEQTGTFHPSTARSQIEDFEGTHALRRKLQLSVFVPMTGLLVVFAGILYQLNHDSGVQELTRESGKALDLAAHYVVQSESNEFSINKYSELALLKSLINQSLNPDQLFFRHDIEGTLFPSVFDQGLYNKELLSAISEQHKSQDLLGNDIVQGEIQYNDTRYVWLTKRIDNTQTWFSTAVPLLLSTSTFYKLVTIEFILVLLSVIGTALWSSRYIIRKFFDKMRENSETLNHRATHDALTGLPNRQKIEQILSEMASSLNPHREQIVLLLVDIIDFRDINDTLGYALGDELIKKIGDTLKTIEPENSCAIRMGGDVFCLAAVVNHDKINASRLSNLVHDKLERTHELNDVPVSVQIRIGMSVYPTDTCEVDQLIRFADIAQAQAKNLRLKDCFYHEDQDTHSVRKLTLLARLRAAIEDDELTLVYQPKLDLSTGDVAGVEVLVRWTDSQYGLVSPVEFVSWAERSGLIDKLTKWVLQSAEAQCREWRNRGMVLPFAVNLSPMNIYDSELVPLISRLVNRGSFGGGLLELEITENAVMEDPEKALQTMKQINKMGVPFAIDDFGTGLSSFAYLRKFPVSNLKIDRAFVMDTDDSDRDAVLLKSMIKLGHELGCHVTAEGVEDDQSMEKLRSFSCDYVQGYHVCKPLTADEFVRWYDARGQEKHTHVA